MSAFCVITITVSCRQAIENPIQGSGWDKCVVNVPQNGRVYQLFIATSLSILNETKTLVMMLTRTNLYLDFQIQLN